MNFPDGAKQNLDSWFADVGASVDNRLGVVVGGSLSKGLVVKLDRGQSIEDVRVIHFDIVDDGDLRTVVDELAALVEKGGVVLVALDNEPFALREARPLTQVLGDSADEKAWIPAAGFEHPGQQGSRRCFPVCAGHDQGTAIL